MLTSTNASSGRLKPSAMAMRRARSRWTPVARRCAATVNQRYCRLACRVGLRSTRLHALRHHSATELIATGAYLRTVAGWLGHGSGGGRASTRALSAPDRTPAPDLCVTRWNEPGQPRRPWPVHGAESVAISTARCPAPNAHSPAPSSIPPAWRPCTTGLTVLDLPAAPACEGRPRHRRQQRADCHLRLWHGGARCERMAP